MNEGKREGGSISLGPGSLGPVPSARGRLPRGGSPRAFSTRYSAAVRVLRIVLPLVAVSLFALVILWPELGFEEHTLAPSALRVDPRDAEELRMSKARYVGIDRNGRPYNVTASDAVQTESSDEAVDLTLPRGDFVLEDGAWIWVEANDGVYMSKTGRLQLLGEVALFHDRGLEVHTEEAFVDLEEGTARGDKPVIAHAPEGIIEGQGFRISGRGAVVTVTGKSKLTIRELPGDDDGAAPAERGS